MNVTDLGFTQEELRDLIIQRAADKIATEALGEDYYESVETRVERKVRDALEDATRQAIDKAIAKHVEPFVQGEIEKIVFQRTNEWGEKTGQPQTFRELLIARAEAYLIEPVNYEGKSQKECGSYSFTKTGTRVAHMVDKHLHYEIKRAMEAALTDLNTKVAGGLLEATRTALNATLSGLKLDVKTK